jgi:hypothetical protein
MDRFEEVFAGMDDDEDMEGEQMEEGFLDTIKKGIGKIGGVDSGLEKVIKTPVGKELYDSYMNSTDEKEWFNKNKGKLVSATKSGGDFDTLSGASIQSKDFVEFLRKKKSQSSKEMNLNEISSDTFKSAINVSRQRGTDIRTDKLSKLYLHQFMGKDLMGGKITNIGIFPDDFVYIEITKSTEPDSDYYKSGQKMIKLNFKYDIDNDMFDIKDKIDRKDAVVFSKIAQKINPETKYKETGKYFNIKGY